MEKCAGYGGRFECCEDNDGDHVGDDELGLSALHRPRQTIYKFC